MKKLIFVLFLLCLVGTRPLQATPTTDAVVGNGTPASCTEAAFNTALAIVLASGDGVLSFNCGGSASIIFTSQKEIVNSNFVLIEGGGQITLSGGNSTRLFHVANANFYLSNITLTNGNSGSGYGGAILLENNSSVDIRNSTIQNNQSNGWAGSAIFAHGTADIALHDSTVQNNHTSSYGAINSTGPVTITDSFLWNNHSDAGGGALSVGGNVIIQNSELYGNRAEGMGGNGGGLYATNTANVIIENSLISANKADQSGGGVFTAGEMTISNSTIGSNQANNEDGGGFYLSGTSAYVTLENSIVTTNTALDDGGGIYVSDGELIVYQSTVSFNEATEDSGGGVRVGGPNSIARFTQSVVYENYAEGSGGAVDILSGTATFDNVTISQNRAANGGGIDSSNGSVTLNYTTITQNENFSAPAGGANISLNATNLTVQNTIFSDPVGYFALNCDYGEMPSATISNGFNLASDGTCLFFLTHASDVNYEPALLGELLDNGGETLTHMPLAGSPVIDGGTCFGGGLMVDQRGAARPVGNACDIGAVEVQSVFQIYLPFVMK